MAALWFESMVSRVGRYGKFLARTKEGTQSLGVGCPRILRGKNSKSGDEEIHDERCFYTGGVQVCTPHRFFCFVLLLLFGPYCFFCLFAS